MEAQIHDISWAAGILEGEGCFSFFQRKKNPEYYQCSIICEMTDKDTIESLRRILSVGNINYRRARQNRKESWILTIQKQKEVFDTLIRIGPYLGERRTVKAEQMFSYLEPIVCK